MNVDNQSRNISYHLLKSIVSSGKRDFELSGSFDSFRLIIQCARPFVEPTFKKTIWDSDRPKVILISAVGATGKTTLAENLSHEIKLPLLDLSKHKPVGDNTLTGLITSTFRVEDLSTIFQSIGDGNYGIIIDGIDEGRSKTNGKAFDAFLDDIVKLCNATNNLSFLLLGRTQVLEDCWLYFDQKGIPTNMLSIAPFSLDNAKKYIDTFTGGLISSQKSQYIKARDFVLDNLHKAFVDNRDVAELDFLQFIGYPPVLDAITTLLNEEKNYHKIIENLRVDESSELEISLLNEIATYILRREKEQKVVPNIIRLISSGLPYDRQNELAETCFSIEEQCIRLVCFCSNQKIDLNIIQEQVINKEYENRLEPFIVEHPFLNGHKFRNAVFESLTIAVLLCDAENLPRNMEVIYRYLSTHKHNYYLIYFLENIGNKSIPSKLLKFLLNSALEFISPHSKVELTIEDRSSNSPLVVHSNSSDLLNINIDISFGNERSKSFLFSCSLLTDECIEVGSNLGNIFVSVAHDIVIGGETEIELATPIQIAAKTIRIDGSSLLVKQSANFLSVRQESQENDLGREIDRTAFIEGVCLQSNLDKIETNGLDLTFAFENEKDISYPVIQYFEKRNKEIADPMLREKYVGLRKLLMEFRSHSRGTMARFKDKIESDQIIGNEIGRKILNRLLDDKVLTFKGKFYFLEPEAVHKYLGVSWLDIRNGQTDQKLIQYLKSIS